MFRFKDVVYPQPGQPEMIGPAHNWGKRGVLWGPLAAGALIPRAECAETDGAHGSSATECRTAMVDLPSLAGTSDLSSGVLSGVRNALVWANGDPALTASVSFRCGVGSRCAVCAFTAPTWFARR